MKKNKMLIKTAVALAGITLTVSILFFTPLWGTAILTCALSVMSCYELLVPTGVCQKPVPVIVCLLTAAAVPWLRYFDVAETGTLLFSLCLLTFAFLYSAAADQYHSSKTIAYLLLASIVFPSFFSLLLPVLDGENGKRIVLIPFIAAWSADTGAQFGGKIFGRHKLAPHISPNKTVEGFFCGLAGSVLGMAIFCLVIHIMGHDVSWLSLLCFGLLGAAFGTVGGNCDKGGETVTWKRSTARTALRWTVSMRHLYC
ncbi:MAG: phosphatidate cytidylyltransferase [Clostridiaceae bacterium]|nr:phosphatidate cytidylyltransferase [Clostridiaceae bacterium]